MRGLRELRCACSSKGALKLRASALDHKVSDVQHPAEVATHNPEMRDMQAGHQLAFSQIIRHQHALRVAVPAATGGGTGTIDLAPEQGLVALLMCYGAA
eukprot:8127538-Karenia_brevis.AAC.1